jgi:outer membrane protein OmpA-like peptidoglycan-associated protein
MACRNPAVTSPKNAADQLLRDFCLRGLPDPRAWKTVSVAPWLQAPDAPAIRTYAQQTLDAQRAVVEKLLSQQNSIQGDDESQGLLGFKATGELDDDAVLVVQQVAERLAARLGSGAASGVVVVGYPDAPGGTVQARQRADAVAQVLRTHPVFATRSITTDVGEASRAPAARTPGVPGMATVHPVVPLRAADAFASVGEIRFPVNDAKLDDASLAVIGRAAAQIRQAQLDPNAPLVVYGYADASSSNSTDNERLAQQRANAIRDALLLALRDDGFTPERIVARGRVLNERVHTYSAARREEVRSGAILAGGSELDVGADQTRVATPSQAQAPSAASVLSAEGIATAAAQALVQRAEREVEAFVFQLVGSEICEKHQPLLPETCLLAHDPESIGNGYQLSFGNLQEVIRRDFSRLPAALVTQALDNRFLAQLRVLQAVQADTSVRTDVDALQRRLRSMPPPNAASAQAVFATYLASHPAEAGQIQEAGGWAVAGVFGLDFVRRVSDGENPLRALQQFPGWVDRNVRTRPGLVYLAESVPVARVTQFARFMSGVDSAALAFRTQGLPGITADTLHLYAVRSVLVNVGHAERLKLVQHLGHLIMAGRQFQEMLVTGDSLRREIRDLRRQGEDGVEARKQLLAEYLGDVAGTFYTLLPSDLGSDVERDSVVRIAANVRDVVYALQAGELRSAFTSTVTLISHLLGPRLLAVNCQVATLAGCGRLGLDPRAVRLAAFASDISAAQSSSDVRDAMSRFIDAGSDVATKRTGPPEWRVFVNAYVAGAGECCDYAGIQLPVGLELVRRGSSARPGRTWSVYVRAVELSGFLPRKNQEGGRGTEEVVASLVRPGLFLIRAPFTGNGWRNLVVGAGVSSWTQLQEGETETDEDRWKWKAKASLFLGWDLPIFP